MSNSKSTVLQEEMQLHLIANYYKMTDKDIAMSFIEKYKKVYEINSTVDSLRKRFGELRSRLNLAPYATLAKELEPLKKQEDSSINIPSSFEILNKKDKDKDKIIKSLRGVQGGLSIEEISNKISASTDYVRYIINEIVAEGYDCFVEDDKYLINTEAKQGGYHTINLEKFENKVYRFGAIADTHLNSKFERLDVLNALYDTFEKEKITTVLHGGNWVDGEARFNKYDLINHGMTKQVNYFIKNYPQRKNIKTLIISGDDHEGWWWQREGVNAGEYLEMKAVQHNRKDLVNLGYVEADIELKASEGSAKLRLMHGGGGTAYAMSYTPQKMIESFQGGEKPSILLLGHYHKADYIFYRDVHCLQLGTTQQQTTFMRKKKIQAHIGGWIIEFQQSKDGAINRFKCEWLSYFNDTYYERNLYYTE